MKCINNDIIYYYLSIKLIIQFFIYNKKLNKLIYNLKNITILINNINNINNKL